MRTPSITKPILKEAAVAKAMVVKCKLRIDHHQHYHQQQRPCQQKNCTSNATTSSSITRRPMDHYNRNNTSEQLDLISTEAALWNILDKRRRARAAAAARRRAQEVLPEVLSTEAGKVWRKTTNQYHVYQDSNAKLLHLIPAGGGGDCDDDVDVITATTTASTTQTAAATIHGPSTGNHSTAAARARALRLQQLEQRLPSAGLATGVPPAINPPRFLVRPRFPSQTNVRKLSSPSQICI